MLSLSCGRLAFDKQPLSEDAGTQDAPGIDATACLLRLVATAESVNLGSSVAFTASLGRPPYHYAIDSGTGSINAETGLYHAADLGGLQIISATDSVGCGAVAKIEVGGSSLFIIGGRTGGSEPYDGIWRSTNGLDWSLVGNLPEARYFGTTLVYNNKIWYFGGETADPSTLHDTVWSSGDGVDWTEVGSLPTNNIQQGATVRDGRMWLVGGAGRDIYWSIDGATWTTVGAIPEAVHGISLLVHQGRFIVAGGHAGVTPYPDSVYASDDGMSWTTIGTLPIPSEYEASLVIDDVIWRVGGQNAGSFVPEILRSSDGIDWDTVGTLPTGASHGSITLFQGRYWFANYSGSTELWSSSNLLDWVAEAILPQALEGFRMVQFSAGN